MEMSWLRRDLVRPLAARALLIYQRVGGAISLDRSIQKNPPVATRNHLLRMTDAEPRRERDVK